MDHSMIIVNLTQDNPGSKEWGLWYGHRGGQTELD